MTNNMDNFFHKICDNSYIEWIEEFTNKHNEFSDNRIPKKTLLTSNDTNNITLLSTFYQEIIGYINCIYNIPIISYYGSYFVIKYNDSFYLMGFTNESHFCSKLKDFNSEKFIEYDTLKNHIMNKGFALVKSKKNNQVFNHQY